MGPLASALALALVLPPTDWSGRAQALLAEARVPYGAIALVRVADAHVLALAAYSAREPELGSAELALAPWAPAASVFKLVTAAALLDGAGVEPGERVCFHGGMHALERTHLVDVPRLDRDCETLGFAIAHSQNAIIAKLAHRHLDPARLGHYAAALGFGEELPFDPPVIPSVARLPAEPLAFARTAAGFWNVSLSPLHAALLARAIAAGGEFRGPDGQGPARRAMSEQAARTLGEMMVGTTLQGTARAAFHDADGRSRLPFPVAGKTGSLTRAAPYVAYSWFVGFAPADRPEVAFAVLIGNGEDRRVKAAQVAERLLASLYGEPVPEPSGSPEPAIAAARAPESGPHPRLARHNRLHEKHRQRRHDGEHRSRRSGHRR
jgi:cell division protein FtsI/penicillin-binding protein 2